VASFSGIFTPSAPTLNSSQSILSFSNMLQILKQVVKKALQVPANFSYQIALIRHASQHPDLTLQELKIVDACRKEGVCVTSLQDLGIASTPQLLKAAESQLALMEKAAASSGQRGSAANPALPQIFMVADLPEFDAWARDRRLLSLIENYIGLPVKFQGVHLRRDFANEKPVTTELWHRDDEDRRIIKVFVYLTDVGEENGPYEYIPRDRVSWLKAWRIQSRVLARRREAKLGIDDAEMATFVPRSEWKSCPCPAGTVVFSDTRAVFHHGKSRQKSRSAIFFVYTAADPLHPEFCAQYHDQTFARPEPVLQQNS
jgi:Phytanoyl-CoA dioxygenase (PhyH)